jgi:hypothetical protein
MQRSSGTLNLQGFSNEVAERSTLKVFSVFVLHPIGKRYIHRRFSKNWVFLIGI